MDVGERTFGSLQKDQNISVKFDDFPVNLIELIEYCLRGPIVGATPNLTSSYRARLDVTTKVFSIIEAKHFNNVTHISLHLECGDDQAIKEYLASRLALSLEQGKQYKATAEQLQLNLEEELAIKNNMSTELYALR
jgi:hypothetical protein